MKITETPNAQPNILGRNTALIVVILCSLALIILNILRILHVPVTHDEGLTFVRYVSLSYSDIVSYKNPTANNHILNTLLTKLLMSIFHNQGVFVLRMGSLLAQMVYMLFCWLIVKKLFSSNWWRAAVFIVLNFNAFLFEFWGLCRGYSLAVAAMTGSIYFMLVYLQTKNMRAVWVSLLLAMLGVYSNFSLLNFYMALSVVFFVDGWLQKRSFKSMFILLAICTVILAVLIARPLVLLRSHHELYYGGDKGIVADTICTLLVDCWHLANSKLGGVLVAAYVVAICGVLPGVYWGRKVIRNKQAKNDITINIGVALWLLLVLPCIFISMQHILLGTKVLISRTALFLVPLYLFAMLYMLSQVWKPMVAYLPAVLCVPMLINFFADYSIRKSWTWSLDEHNVVILDHIMAENLQPNHKINLRVDWQFAPGLQYYTSTYYAGKFEPVIYTHDDVKLDSSYDYYYIFQGDAGVLKPAYMLDTALGRGIVLLKRNDH